MDEATLSDYQFELPEELIAQEPTARRDGARLLLLERKERRYEDRTIQDLTEILRGNELIVFNDTRVVPARLHGQKESGGKVELLVIRPRKDGFLAMAKASKKFQVGMPIIIYDATGKAIRLEVEEVLEDGHLGLSLPEPYKTVWELCEAAGEVPLPPYMHRSATEADKERYQTVYAKHEGAVAAPTAGLHFTESMLQKLQAKGCELAFVTLHVGPGTFLPVRSENLSEHHMHEEFYHIPEETLTQIAKAKEEGRPVLAVGTTVVRTLEGNVKRYGKLQAGFDKTELFIREGFHFQVVDQLMTNFHLPGSTLLMLVSAFSERGFMLEAYRHAVKEGYRFFSYGDGMLLR